MWCFGWSASCPAVLSSDLKTLEHTNRAAHNGTRRRRVPAASSAASAIAAADMDSEARRRACVVFRDKLSRDTGVTLAAADCAGLLERTFQSRCVCSLFIIYMASFFVCL